MLFGGKMQKFPKDTKDDLEKEYGDRVLEKFPVYGKFWEKFIGYDNSYKDSILPRKPIFPKNYSNINMKKFLETQLWLSKVSYSIFCNIVSLEKQLEEYKNSSKNLDINSYFWTMESLECAYFHIGNISFGLESIWGKLKNKKLLEQKYHELKLEDFLITKNNEKNFHELRYGEAQRFRNSIVHNFRNIHTVMDGKYYFPSVTDPNKFLWSDMKFDAWVLGSLKLKLHIELALKACEDVYSTFIPLIESYIKKEGIHI